MRYVCYKQIVSKIIDQTIAEVKDIKSIFKVLIEHELTCSLSVQDTHGVLSFNNVRIKSVDEEDFNYVTYTSSSQLRKKSKYKDVLYLEMTTADKVLTILKPNIDRGSMIEPGDMDELE